MSAWDPYVNSITQTYEAQKAKNGGSADAALLAVGIFGDNGARWASTANIAGVTQAECAALARGCNGDAELCGTGFTLAGNKFACTKVDTTQTDYCMVGKGKKEANEFGTGAFFAYKVKGAILFAIGNDQAQGGDVNMAVSTIAEYLRGAGYEV